MIAARVWFLFAIGLFVTAPACGAKNETTPTVCTAGQSIACIGAGGCSGGQVCKGDGSGYEPCDCAGPADSGLADSTAPEDSEEADSALPDTAMMIDATPGDGMVCFPGTKDCKGATPRICDSTGDWRELAACSGTKPFCKSGECTTFCAAGEYSCEGGSLQRCNSDMSGWEAVMLCGGLYCDVAKKTCTECKPGDKGCSGTTPRTCDSSGNWVSSPTCSGSTPYCSAGACVASTLVMYSQSFTSGVVSGPGTAQCTAWSSFRTALTAGTYTKLTLSGSKDTVGATCTGSAANTLCRALGNGTTIDLSIACDGRQWRVGQCSGGSGSNWAITASGTDPCACFWGHAVRPCMGTAHWGGVSTDTCEPPSQTLTVRCE